MANEKDIHDLLDIYLKPFVSILTFIAGYFVSQISVNYKKNKRQKALVEYYIDYLKKQQQANINFKENIEELIRNIQSDLKFQIGALKVNLQPFVLIESIDKIELRDALESKNNKSDIEFVKSFLAIEFLKGLFNKLVENHMKFVKGIDDILLGWNKQIGDFHDLKTEFSSYPREELYKNKDFIFLNETYNNWVKNDKKSLENTEKYLIKPLIEYFGKLYGENPGNIMATRILKSAQMLNVRLFELKESQRIYCSILIEYVKNLQDQIDYFKTILSSLPLSSSSEV